MEKQGTCKLCVGWDVSLSLYFCCFEMRKPWDQEREEESKAKIEIVCRSGIVGRNTFTKCCFWWVFVFPFVCGLCCVALRCVALRCVALRCVALRCVALRCVTLWTGVESEFEFVVKIVSDNVHLRRIA